MRRALHLAVLCLLVVLFLPPRESPAQELFCDVGVDISQLQGNDFSFLRELEVLVEEYLNGRAWTDDFFLENERIDCTLSIIFQEAITQTSFRAQLTVGSKRPIYGTVQQTTVVQLLDADWTFNYTEGAALQFNPDRYDPLATVLDFYAYLMLGYDYDTFGELGGTPYFEQARRIADRANAEGRPGWSQIGTERGRTALVAEVLDKRFEPLRKAYFDYHFGALDRFLTEIEVARANALQVLESLATLREDQPRSYALDVFFTAKYQDIIGVFQDSQLAAEAFDLLGEVDPSRMSFYNELLN